MQIIGLLSILIAFFALVFFSFKGYSLLYVAPLCALFVAICNQLPLLTAFTEIFMGGFSGIVKDLFLIFLSAILMGRLYMDSGAALSIAKFLMNLFGRKSTGKRKQTIAIAICGLTGFALAYGGIDTFCVLFTLFPVVLTVCKEADIPRKYMLGILNIGVATAAVSPGAPLVPNYIPMEILGTSAYAGLIPGIVAALIVFCGGIFYCSRAVHLASDRGMHFEYGPVKVAPEREGRKYPNIILAILPIVAVILVFNLTGALVAALFAGDVVALLALGWFYDPQEGQSKLRTIVGSLNEGCKTAAESICLMAILVGFAAVVQATPVFDNIVNVLMGLPIPAMLLVVLSVAIIVAFTGSPPAGLQIILPILSTVLVGVAPEAIHRVATISTQTFDTLPFQGAVIVTLGLCGLTHKEGYFPVMMTTVIWTGAAAVVASLMLTFFPGLA